MLSRFYLLTIGSIMVLLSCNQDRPASQVTMESQELFTYVDSSSSGLSFINQLVDSDQLNIVEYLYYYNGGGVAIGDINNDGLEDIFMTANQGPDKLYLNKGDMKFEDVSSQAGISQASTWSTGVSIDDVNGDGWMDIYVCKVAKLHEGQGVHNELYINQQDGTFKEVSKDYGLDFAGYATQAAFLDYDNDGDLDVYLLNHTVHSVRSYGRAEKRMEFDPFSGDRFYENKLTEKGVFEDVTKQSKIYSSPLGYGLTVTCTDVNNDGFVDIYVGNDFHENDYLYINNGDKTFKESNHTLLNYTSQFSMGVDAADMNNDGWQDLFTTDMLPYDKEVALQSAGEDSDQIKKIKSDLGFEVQHARNHFQINQAGRGFVDVAYATQTYATDWSWSILLQDYDNNGAKDIFITNGIVKRPNDLDYINYLASQTTEGNQVRVPADKLIEKMPSQPLSNFLFKGQGAMRFSDLKQSHTGKPSFSNGAAYADLDNDGDLDLVVNNINAPAYLMQNESQGNGSYMAFQLVDKTGKTTKGSKVIAYSGGNRYVQEYQTVKGFLSSSTHTLFMGLGGVKVDSIHVLWTDHTMQSISVQPNQAIKVIKDASIKMTYPQQKAAFDIAILPYKHTENNYIDENSEKLMPERLSYEGPALLMEDFDGDGLKDMYLGGGRGQSGAIYLANKAGGFDQMKNIDFANDAGYEDISAALIDFDKDGDQDLYVVSGGNDNNELDKLLEDRLYLNNGGGNFKRIPISLPHTNGSVVAVGDLDGDGYEDLFIGARSIPGMYGLSPYSFVLKNMGGQGVEIAYKERFGMVTDAVWEDLDGDGKEDLIFCGDWMPIRVLKNDGGGTLSEITKQMGLEQYHGFWNNVTVADVDGDGKKDIIAGNLGINTKLTASQTEPIDLYMGDFDKNGSSDPIVFYYFFGQRMPFASLDRLASQLPMLKKKFNAYRDFAKVAGIEDLLGSYRENLVESKYVNELRSMVFYNEGELYKANPLPDAAQMGDTKDILFDKGSLYLVGNNGEFVSELGKAMSHTGYKISGISPNNEGQVASLGLPLGVNSRKIDKVRDGVYIVGSNDGFYYLVKDLSQ